ncbi:MAG TPA: GrpB family protein [Ktedonobacterales bacterium]|nr:GrpB family protein [Ktedonobacterales bacterium]
MPAPEDATDDTPMVGAVEDQPPVATRVTTEEEMRAAHVGPLAPLNGRIVIAEYDPAWPQLFAREAERIRAALGDRVVALEHVGSTSVPGLAAKPRIDMLLIVPNSAGEPGYVPAMEAAGYTLHIREPEWYEHRVFNGPDTDVNIHVFSPGCPEVTRMLRFRDWLRSHPADRQLYEQTKRRLAQQEWQYTQNYADAKTAVVKAILARAQQG